MTPTERRASASLASIFALRMLGLFLVLPVFALEARKYPGGDDPALLGLAMGIYGLTQGVLQLPYGMASDRFGRKRVIVLGLLIFALGSFWASAATDLHGLLLGRSLQGAGAVSAAVTALLADLTRDEVRTKAMALVGASIGLMFAVSLVLAPVLAGIVGLAGLFAITGTLALLGVTVVVWGAPPEPAKHADAPGASGGRAAPCWPDAHEFRCVCAARGAAGHVGGRAGPAGASRFAQGATLAGLSASRAGFVRAHGGHVRAGAAWPPQKGVSGSHCADRAGADRVSGGGLGHAAFGHAGGLAVRLFCGFNILEATQPSLVSRLAPMQVRGTAMGVYNTLQSLGFFVGGWAGGALLKSWGSQMLFLCCAAAMLLWWLVALPMQAPGRQAAKTA